jgi:DNA-directed RNA polymerase subunit RPC12/RpoP
MPQTITNCPRCKTRVPVEFQQVFDLNVDPQAKNRFLSRNYNLISCPTCGYQGNMATPLVYHDPEKELLLTYFPAELGLPVNEQEKILGPIITGVVNALPNDKKKGYLFSPGAMFTL